MNKNCTHNKLKGIVGLVLWFSSFVALILSWMAIGEGAIWGVDPLRWLLTALVLGVLSTPCSIAGDCPCCCDGKDCANCSGKGCKTCK